MPKNFFCVYNVMLVELKDGVAYRLGLGWVHVDAFHQAFPEKKTYCTGLINILKKIEFDFPPLKFSSFLFFP